MTYHHQAFADAEAAWHCGKDPASIQASAVLPPYFGQEGLSRDTVISEQRSFIEGWLVSAHQFAIVMCEIAERRAEAFAAEGLT